MNKAITFEVQASEERKAIVSGREVNLAEIEHILLSHEAVLEAKITDVTPKSGKNKLVATICLKKGYPPSNEMKTELAWHVVADLGLNISFKNIDFVKQAPKPQMKKIADVSDGCDVHISGHKINTSEVKRALESHECVANASVNGVDDPRKGEALMAHIELQGGVSPSNDLKTQLAWHVQSTVSPFVVFKNINFADGNSQQAKKNPEAHESMVIVDKVGDEGVSMHISSHKISTTEVTMTLLKHPNVADAAVVNVPDEGVGEKMKAFVKLKEGTAPSNDLKLELAWFVMSELKPIAIFKSVHLETRQPEPNTGASRERATKEQVLISGHTILSSEVEKTLEHHGSVAEAIVIGVPDEKHGEALKAFVTLKEGGVPTEDLKNELAWHARTEIGPDVVFKSIDFKKYLPKTDDKEALKSVLWADTMNVPAKISITVAD